MKRPVPEDVAQLRREHEAMASTLCEAENLVSEVVMGQLRRHYMECILAAREHGSRRCPRGGFHAWPRSPARDGRECLKCGALPS